MPHDSLPHDSLDEAVRARIAALQPELAAIRQDIHAHPELGMEEQRTSRLVAEKLRAWGVEVTEGVGRFGVVGTVRGRRPGQRAIGLRADMDALAIAEQTGMPYASRNAGRMHACGHDGHTTMLLGAARMLAENPDFGGTVHLIFQPAEEGRGGASAMLADGLFERFSCDAVYGMHCWPGGRLGTFGLRKGAFLAAASRWDVRFLGTGGHGGAAPHQASDLSVVAAHFILALQSIVARNVPPLETAVISVGHIAGGANESANVMPAELVVAGTARCFSREVQDLLDRRMRELAEGLAALHGARAEVAFNWATTPLVNHPEQTDVAAAAAAAVVGAGGVDAAVAPITGGEDFAFMLERKPGAFIFLGNGVEADGSFHQVHTPKFNFNDAAIPHGVGYWVSLVQRELGI